MSLNRVGQGGINGNKGYEPSFPLPYLSHSESPSPVTRRRGTCRTPPLPPLMF